VDVSGAIVLRDRLAQQEHWRRARSVRVGAQPATDPDGHALESFRACTRYYREQRRREVVDGRNAVVTTRLCKYLVDGAWEAELLVERVDRVV
jgi:hypothetical protein